MKAVLRWGALAAGVVLAAGGAQAAPGQEQAARGKRAAAATSAKAGGKAPASSAKAPAAPAPRKGGVKLDPVPRLADGQKDALADRKRDEAIAGFRRLLDKVQDGNPRKADLLYRLSELYWEKSQYLYRLEMTRYLEAEKAYEARQARGEKAQRPEQDHEDSERYRLEAMALYGRLLDEYPKYEAKDEVIFALGYNLMEMGRRDEAVKRYQQLIREFPQSRYVPDTYVQLGNHYFDTNNLQKAREAFEKARASDAPKIRAYALYKLAWCDYNSGDVDAGLKKLHQVVDYAEQHGQELGDLKTEALNDSTLFYVQLDRPRDAIAYYKQKAPQRRAQRLVARTADGLAEAGHFDSAILAYRTLVQDEPMGPGAPEYQQAIVRAHEGLRQRTQVRAEMRRMVELYRPGGEWWKANQKDAAVLRNAFSVTEEAMRVMVTEYHQEAQKTRQVETYRLARDIYKEYVDAFASSDDPDFVADSAFNLRFFYAEILWALEEWESAAAAYDAVVTFEIPDRDSAREVSEEKYRKQAAYAAVLAYDKLVKIDRGQLARSDLKDGQKVDEKKDKGDVDAGKIVKRDASDLAEQKLTPHEGRLVAAIDTYNKLYPGGQDEVDLRYQAAVILYDRHHFLDAVRRFAEIIEKFPEEKRSQDAADLSMYVLETRGEWLELNQTSRRFLGNKRLTRPGSDFARRVALVVEGSQYKWVDEVVYRKEKKPAKAAEEFLKFVAEFPRSENADRALTYAMVIATEARELDKGVTAGERVLAEYKGSPFELKVRYTLGGLYEKLAEFRKSAAMYESFVAAYDAAKKAQGTDVPRGKGPKAQAPAKVALDADAEAKKAARAAERKQLLAEADKWVPDALFNAGLWWEGVGESKRAVEAYGQYITRFKDKKDVPEIAYNVALVHEKDGKWREAARAFDAFAGTYARDARTPVGRVYLARYRQLLALQKAKDAKEAERLGQELVRGFARLSDKEKQAPGVLDAYAHARFLELEPLWKRYNDIRFTRVQTLRQDLAAKQREMAQVEKSYAAVLAVGSGEWGIAALTRIGLAYGDFARNILESPDPKGLDEDQKALYRGELQNLAMPLEDKAAEALEKGLEKAYELALYNDYTLAAQDALNRYRPGLYAQVRQVPYRGSESFATAGLLKDAVIDTTPAEAAAPQDAQPQQPQPAAPQAPAPKAPPVPTASAPQAAVEEAQP